MRFDSLTFIVFLAITIGLYALLQQWRHRKLWLILASYIFYAAWNPPFVLLLWFSTLVDFRLAKLIHKSTTDQKRKAWLILSLISNLGLLAFFKYGNFLLENFIFLSKSFGLTFKPAEFSIILPIGISFYTFQTLSYTIDVYRKKLEPTDKLTDFALFVTFFPQLVAGPIVRAVDFLPQLISPKKLDKQAMGWGAILVTIGLFYKQVFADALFSPVSDQIFNADGAYNALSAWAGVLAFTGQIFCDFAGYSIIAIGLARMFGFTLPDNFNAPYAAEGFSDFWRRWHITLSSWLRDYLYISLGGNRGGRLFTARNLVITMLLGGLWHGAAWTFVIWGGLHGFYLILERQLRNIFPLFFASKRGLNKIIIRLVTLLLVIIAWIPFRATDFPSAWSIFTSLFHINSAHNQILTSREILSIFLGISFIIGSQWIYRDQKSFSETISRVPYGILSVALAAMIWLIVTLPAPDKGFIYFQF